jgi:predicted anti-sigma-YlaC factor YlaD
MQHEHNQKKIEKICRHLGEDLDAIHCKEVADHLSKCPTCKVYFDTVEKTVILCKKNDCLEKIPDDVNKRMLKVLHLDDL